jgi:O-antigen ligase
MTEFAISGAQRSSTRIGDRVRALTVEDVALGTAALAVAALPLLVPSGPGNTSPVDVFIGLAMAATVVWAVRSGHRWSFPFGIAMALYVAGGAIGALAGPVPGKGVVSLLQDFDVLFWCWTLANLCSSSRRLSIVLSAWAYGATAWASLLVVGFLTGSATLTGQRAQEGARTTLTLHDPNFAGSYFFVSLMIIWATGRPRRLGARLVASLLLVVGIASTGSNSALVSLAAGLATVLLLSVYRRRGGRAALAALACVALAGYLASLSVRPIEQWAQGSSYAFLRDGIGRGTSSIWERSTILDESLSLYRTGGVLGQGPNSTKTRMAAEQLPYAKVAHDDYLGTLLERGVVGAVGLILLFGGLLQRAFCSATRPLRPSFAKVVPYPNALAGALVGTLIGSALIQLMHARHVWALFALIAAVSIWGVEWRPAQER